MNISISICPMYPVKFIRDSLVAPSVRLLVVIVTLPTTTRSLSPSRILYNCSGSPQLEPHRCERGVSEYGAGESRSYRHSGRTERHFNASAKPLDSQPAVAALVSVKKPSRRTRGNGKNWLCGVTFSVIACGSVNRLSCGCCQTVRQRWTGRIHASLNDTEAVKGDS